MRQTPSRDDVFCYLDVARIGGVNRPMLRPAARPVVPLPLVPLPLIRGVAAVGVLGALRWPLASALGPYSLSEK